MDVKISDKGRWLLNHPEIADKLSQSLADNPLKKGEQRYIAPGVVVMIKKEKSPTFWENIGMGILFTLSLLTLLLGILFIYLITTV